MRPARPLLLLAVAASLTACGGGGGAGEGAGACDRPHALGGAVEAGHVVRTVPTRDPRELATLSPDQASLVEQLAAAEAAHAQAGATAPGAPHGLDESGHGAEVSGGSEHRALASGGGSTPNEAAPEVTCAPEHAEVENKEAAGH